MSFLHTVLMEIVDADPGFHEAVAGYCARIVAECEGVLSYDYTCNGSDRSDGLGHAVIALFDSSDAHDRYQVSRVHQEMKAFMAPRIRRLIVFDGTVAIRALAPHRIMAGSVGPPGL